MEPINPLLYSKIENFIVPFIQTYLKIYFVRIIFHYYKLHYKNSITIL